MERLTYRDKDGMAMMKERGGWKSGGIERLAAYEDTGLEPEEIYEVRFLIAAQRDPKKLARLRELVQAEQDGRLVVLPCKVGDTVYTVQQVGRGHWEEDKYILDDRGTPKVYEKKFSLILLEYIGKTVFLTREEAEAALALKGGDLPENRPDRR